MLGDKFSNTRFALILGGTLMMTGVAHADQSDILEPFGGSAHPVSYTHLTLPTTPYV